VITVYSREIFYSLAGSRDASDYWHEILSWYVLGSCLGVLGTFQYYLQNALGTMRLYVFGSTLAFVVQVPLIYLVTTKYGALGVGKLWFVLNSIWFLGWTCFVHIRLLPGFHFKWLARDFLPMLVLVTVLSYLVKKAFPIGVDGSRMAVAAEIAIAGLFVLVIASVSVRSIRARVMETAKAWF
jgi:O-antigen/teichoic acid export membrane protein